jgi:hypothetical protein
MLNGANPFNERPVFISESAFFIIYSLGAQRRLIILFYLFFRRAAPSH